MVEPSATSDKILGKSRINVRTRCNFRQNSRKEPEKWSNLVQLQTKLQGRAGEMSEPLATSDKTPGKNRQNV